MALSAQLYVYGLKCPVTELLRYIGVSSRPKKRLREHLTYLGRGYNRAAEPWFRGIRAIGLKPQLVLLSPLIPKHDALALEREWHVYLHRNFPGQCVNGVSGHEFMYLHMSPRTESERELLERYTGRFKATPSLANPHPHP